jgi:hypothetical protein
MEAFRLSAEKKYDSLSLIMPQIYFENTTNGSQFIDFRPMWQAIKIGDIPSESNLKYSKAVVNGMDGSVITFYPNYNLPIPDSIKLFKVDSIRFSFMSSLGNNKVAHYNVFRDYSMIRTIMPNSSLKNSGKINN